MSGFIRWFLKTINGLFRASPVTETKICEKDTENKLGVESTSNKESSDVHEQIISECFSGEFLDLVAPQLLLSIHKTAQKTEFLSTEDILCGCFIRELLNQTEPLAKKATAVQDIIRSEKLASKDKISNSGTKVVLQNANSTNWIKTAFAPLEYAYKFNSSFDSGTFGQICKLVKRSTWEEVAAKFVKTSEVGNNEIEIWSAIKHPNILPLLETVPSQGAHIFLCPLLKANLHDSVARRKLNFKKLQKYVKDALQGLTYLHSIGICHLDIKADNILVDETVAMICDFGFVTYNSKSIKNGDVGMPDMYRPPEACALQGGEAVIPDGQSCDLWGFGLILVELLAAFPLTTQVKGRGDWHTHVRPVLHNVLQKDEFQKRVKDNFLEIDSGTVSSALDMIHRLLRKTHQKRLKAKDALCHPLFSDSESIREI